ncbi:phage tail protein [Escherichia coli]|uniref:phage tail protein n=4 Tax=Escherichia coli TaxID=562 RepID=UPI000B7CEC62|nr:phage tail protein [Escherichia coli]EFO0125564.1 phage tail protein [Escherichia coli]EHE8695407.1 phage tail protein [Escherichia coli]EHU9708505.1 tail fiber protein [Escherichia coli]QMA25619.1 tail fiber protein [Escherichia coli]HCP9342403.1 tail fiber protein [Escherichia coli]
MNDVTVVTSVTYPSSESLALVADVQYHEPYLSAALNRKFRGIVDPGFYAGFLPKPGGGMNLLITSVDGDKTAGAASVDIGEFYQVTIQQRKDISLALSAGKKYAIVLKGRYLLGEDTYQVNTASHIHAAEFVARTYTDSYQLGDGELLVCTVNIPASVSAITQEMIDTSERINRSIGIDISDSVTSTRSDVAASSLAVKKAYDLAKSKYTAQDASTTQKGLVQLSSATNSDSETMAATPKAVKSIKDLADTKAPIESPSLTGTPTAPTAAQGTNSTQIANTAFVKAAITALINGAPGTLDTLKEIAAAINNDPNFSTTINNALALKAPLASPALTGIPTAPTAAQGTNNTQIATTAYVRAAISALVGSSPEALDTLNELAAALGNDPNFATTMTNALAGKQPLDATLTALAALATGANKLPYFTGKDTVAQTDLTSVGRDILAKTSTLAVIQYLGLRELGTSGEKIPLLSTANTWSARQTFNGGITGALTGNADTATKLKTAININGVRFDGSADITLTPKDLDVYSKSEIDNKKGMRKYTFSAPANAVSGKWYPIVFRRSGGSTDELASRVVITTYSSAGGYAMNNCEFNGFVMPGGWSDRGSYAAGFFSIYSTAERAIHSIISSVKDDDLCSVFYVEARAFPIKIFAEEGLNVIVPTTDYTVGQATYKWGATDPVAESTNTQTILDFKNGRGYYCSHQFVSSLSGNAATATKLASSINIGGVSFDGSADIDLPGVNTKGNQDTTGNAATATKLQTACTINGVSFDGSKDIELNPRSIGTINSTTMSFSGGAGWFKLATVTMPQASSVVYISLIGGAGYNVGSPHQAGISELVLRAGNGNPKGITGALWRRTSIGFTNFAWENTSGDTYDVYVEIGNYATGVNIQWDYTSNASVTIHTSPIYTENKPTGLTDGTVYVIYSSHIKPTAADVGALSLSGGQLNGALGIGTSSALGGNSIVLGDNDTGFKQNGDGNLDVYANNVHVMRFVSGSIQSNKTINITGRVNPSDYGNFDSRYVRDMRLGGASTYKPANNTSTWTHQAPSGCVYTGIIVQDTGSNSADNIGGVYYRPVQKQINGTWYNVAQV